MRATLLGTGTSTGVPVIACACPVCLSPDPRNRRLRPSVLLEEGGFTALIDTPTDLRRQALEHGIRRLDAILYTHHHADHILGLDEVRIFNFRQKAPLPAYGPAESLAAIRRSFWYVFEEVEAGGGKPAIDLRPVDGPFPLGPWQVIPVPLRHGTLTIFGYRIGDFAYLTDASAIPEASWDLLHGLRVLVMNALRVEPHPTHFTLAQSLEAIARIGPGTAYLTHMGHDLEHELVEAETPPHVHPGYDGLALDV